VSKTIKLKITTTRRRAVTVSPAAVRTYCAACQGEVPTLTCREAAEFLEVGERDLSELIAVGKAHAIRTLGGGLRVCQDSLIS
jgi:hypothetical protein